MFFVVIFSKFVSSFFSSYLMSLILSLFYCFLWGHSLLCMEVFHLKYEITTIHGIVKVLTAEIFYASRMEIEAPDIGVINGATTWRVHKIGAVRGGQCV